MNIFKTGLLTLSLVAASASAGINCDVYADAIESCTARYGCDTSIDYFAECLVEEEGITEYAADGTNEVEEVVYCFQTEYYCD